MSPAVGTSLFGAEVCSVAPDSASAVVISVVPVPAVVSFAEVLDESSAPVWFPPTTTQITQSVPKLHRRPFDSRWFVSSCVAGADSTVVVADVVSDGDVVTEVLSDSDVSDVSLAEVAVLLVPGAAVSVARVVSTPPSGADTGGTAVIVLGLVAAVRVDVSSSALRGVIRSSCGPCSGISAGAIGGATGGATLSRSGSGSTGTGAGNSKGGSIGEFGASARVVRRFASPTLELDSNDEFSDSLADVDDPELTLELSVSEFAVVSEGDETSPWSPSPVASAFSLVVAAGGTGSCVPSELSAMPPTTAVATTPTVAATATTVPKPTPPAIPAAPAAPAAPATPAAPPAPAPAPAAPIVPAPAAAAVPPEPEAREATPPARAAAPAEPAITVNPSAEGKPARAEPSSDDRGDPANSPPSSNRSSSSPPPGKLSPFTLLQSLKKKFRYADLDNDHISITVTAFIFSVTSVIMHKFEKYSRCGADYPSGGPPLLP